MTIFWDGIRWQEGDGDWEILRLSAESPRGKQHLLVVCASSITRKVYIKLKLDHYMENLIAHNKKDGGNGDSR
jgi:hypothetical protein